MEVLFAFILFYSGEHSLQVGPFASQALCEKARAMLDDSWSNHRQSQCFALR